MSDAAQPDDDVFARLASVFETAFLVADRIVNGDEDNPLALADPSLAEKAQKLGDTKNAARGVALTLAAYKCVVGSQDIRSHKAEHPQGFSARSFDTKVTIPFLISKGLPRSVESHWLSQTFSFGGPYLPGVKLRTQPAIAGALLIDVVNAVELGGVGTAFNVVVTLLERLIRIRNADKVVLTRPKDLPIHLVRTLIERHISKRYRTNGPRLPQLALYAVYKVMIRTVGRYEGQTLEQLGRMKSADRKSGTIGDVVVSRGGKRTEAVEIKHDQPIEFVHVMEAIEKVRAESVTRYYLLSNRGIKPGDKESIDQKADEFLKQNGCEIIVNGLLDTMQYYIRLLPDTTEFIFEYVNLVESDDDTGFEHRIAWNEICSQI